MAEFPRWRFKPQVSSFENAVVIPSSDPDEGDMTTVCFSYEWLPYVLGALSQLQQRGTWQGTEADKTEAIGLATNLLELFTTPVCDVPAPYWDAENADDADDSAPRTNQIWYGELLSPPEGLTWREQVGYWAITAFLAIAATPAAAIAFTVLAKRFVLAWQTHNLGGIVRVFVDASEVGTVDTYSVEDGVVEMPVLIVDDEEGFVAESVTSHVLWVEMTGEANPAVTGIPSIRVIRKRLDEQALVPAGQRFNPTTGKTQRSWDGGATWVDDPSLDPRHADGLRQPARTGSNAQCDAAANQVKWIKDFIDYEAGLLCAGATLTTVANGVFKLFDILAPWAILADLLIEIAGTLFDIGCLTLTSAFDSSVYDTLRCIFYCNTASNGQVSAAQLANILNDLAASDINATAKTVLTLILQNQGEVGLSNAGAIGSETGDCSDCTDCNNLTWEFFPDVAWASGHRGECVSGVWSSEDRVSGTPLSSEIMMRLVFPVAVTVTGIRITYSKSIGTFAGTASGQTDQFIINSPNGWYNGTVIGSQLSRVNEAGEFNFSGSLSGITILTAWIFAAEFNPGSGSFGSAVVTHVEVDTPGRTYVFDAC